MKVSEEKDQKEDDIGELREVLSVVSQQVPGLIKGIIASVFSEQAGADMGKAVGAFYKGLKDAGIPDETAVKMAENYISTFTSLGEVMKMAVSGQKGKEGEEISKAVREKIASEIEKGKEKE